ncbi:hypothetical protein PPERSA_03512 [Pseudocohnilembus persalinus]|uniref:Uncharacterized protein n=1 Tax=Pseudocohnilembus persalinus TaxID=266149 RepID=A0A0V0R2D3_PSEPJ|nr:hypothetical protein PPERSA_03512 [Pseudocohnilembus persalinus]|eukprot:KRX08641.1 hypothetical protein PPERSA_03512 [Pseudocohnilembus persalinus]
MKIGGLQYENNAFYSKQDWQGLYPQKWNGGKLHLKPADTLNSQQQNQNIPFRPPKRPIQPNQSQIYQYKPHNKQFKGLNGKTTEQSQHKYGVKHVQFNPSQKKSRPELRHLSMQKSDHLEDINYGIKTYEHANQTRGQTWNVENQMNKKQRLIHLDDKRNLISCASLGDKPYKYPENSSDFFKSGGLIPGSSIKARQIKRTS